MVVVVVVLLLLLPAGGDPAAVLYILMMMMMLILWCAALLCMQEVIMPVSLITFTSTFLAPILNYLFINQCVQARGGAEPGGGSRGGGVNCLFYQPVLTVRGGGCLAQPCVGGDLPGSHGLWGDLNLCQAMPLL